MGLAGNQPLQDKVVLLTGASSGIGALTARLLSEAGAVPVLAARREDKLADVSSTIQGTHKIYTLDVRSNDQVIAVVHQIIEQFGRIDVLINNAGYGIFDTIDNMSIEQYEDMMDVNYLGTVRCTKAVLPHMQKEGKGHIVNIASMAGKIGSAKSTGYTATKHAVLGFTNSLRQELFGTGVTVSVVNPGPIDTPFFELADPTGNYVNNIKWFMLKPERVAREIVRIIVRQKPEKDLPFVAAAGTKLYQLFPRLSDRLVSRIINKK